MNNDITRYFKILPKEIRTECESLSDNEMTQFKEKSHIPPIKDNVGDSVNKRAIVKDDSYYIKLYNLKEFKIKLESCDKIWKTLQLIRNMQYNTNDERNRMKNKSTSDEEAEESLPMFKANSSYVAYSPTINNGNIMLPNLSVKSERKLFSCRECDRNFTTFRSLRHHAFKVHCVFIPNKVGGRKKINNHLVATSKNIETSQVKDESIERNTTIIPPAHANSIQESHETNQSLSFVSTAEIETKTKEVKVVRSPINETLMPSSDLIRCILCKRQCKKLRKHIVEYHRVLYPDTIIETCIEQTNKENDINSNCQNNVCTNTELPESTLVNRNVTVSEKSGSSEIIESLRNNLNHQKKEKSNELQRKRCKICLGIYSVTSFAKHLRNHIFRGETKQNIHLFNTRYRNSPLSYRSQCTKNMQVLRSKRPLEEKISVFKKRRCTTTNDSDSFEESPSNSRPPSENADIICDCGRSFRNPHTLYLHKVKCKNIDNGNYSESTARSSSDRDSGIGISITIKKKNDSYEIVNRDSEEEKIKESACNSDVTSSTGEEEVQDEDMQQENRDDENANLDPVNYSKLFEDTSVLKIQTVDDDVEVNIEDVDQPSEIEETQNAESMELITTDTRMNSYDLLINENPCDKTLTSESLHIQETKIHKSKEQKYLPMLCPRRKKIEQSCPCGKKFRVTYFLDLHVKKFHPRLLECGYCKSNFKNYMQYQNHECAEINRTKLDESLFQLPCPVCGVLLDITSNKFDSHTQNEHFDPVLPFQCFMCCERFVNASLRRVHFRNVHKVSPCSICNKKLPFEMKLKHELYHKGIGYPCHKCKKTYSKEVCLEAHRICVHRKNAENKQACKICSKIVSIKSMKTHMRVHQPAKFCKECGISRHRYSDLELHINRKHKSYPYAVCDFCDMRFIAEDLLDKHLKSDNCKEYKNNLDSDA